MPKKDISGSFLTLLNQPFVLWFLSTIVVGAASLMYSQAQKTSLESRLAIKEEKTARLELAIISEDIRNKLRLEENLNVTVMNQINSDFSYQINTSQFKGLRNILIDLDGATGLNGIERFNPIIIEDMKILNNATYRLTNLPVHQQKGTLWSNLTLSEKENFSNIENLLDEIVEYYAD